MLKRLLTALAVVAALAPGAPAHATTPTFAGELCSFDTGITSGYLYGGPLAVADLALVLEGQDDLFGNPVSVTLDCLLRADGVPIGTTSGSGDVVVVAPPAPFASPASAATVEMCSAVTVTHLGGPTEHYYWDYELGGFTTDPAATCYLATLACDDRCSGRDVEEWVDLIVCPKLALLLPPEGDIPNVWDCPPYGS